MNFNVRWYRLVGKVPTQVASPRNATAGKRVFRDAISDQIVVSTVFLGLDHQYGSGPPLLFETMIFGGPNNHYQRRCSTYDEAQKQHNLALAIAKGIVTPPEINS